MSKKPVSLKDLAKELNVSVSTVSRALKNHPDISASLCKKIQDLAQLKNYSPNPLAMGLLRRQTRTIGVIVPDIVTHFYSSIIYGIEEIVSEHGYYVVITSSNESLEKEKRCIKNLLNLRVEGIIVCLSQETDTFSHFDVLQDNEIPLIFFDRVCRTDEFSSVIVNNIEAARQITKHFFDTGSRKIAHIAGPPHLNITQDRIKGYKQGLAECGLPFTPDLLVYSKLDHTSGTTATQKLLSMKQIPDAIFGINDTIAFATMKEVKKNGYKIPEDIAIVGFADELHASYVEPPLSSMIHPTLEMGNRAAQLLLEQTKNLNSFPVQQVILNTELIIRKSSSKLV